MLKIRIITTLTLIAGFIMLYLTLSHKHLTLLAFSNCLFMIGLAFLCIGSFFSIIHSGFFDIFQKSMKSFLKKKEAMHIDDKTTLSQRSKKHSELYWFIVSGTCIILSLILLKF